MFLNGGIIILIKIEHGIWVQLHFLIEMINNSKINFKIYKIERKTII